MFHVGQKVVCVYRGEWGHVMHQGETHPEYGHVYTVRGVKESAAGDFGLLLDQIVNQPVYTVAGVLERPFVDKCFRPVRTTKRGMEIINRLLLPKTKRVKASA